MRYVILFVLALGACAPAPPPPAENWQPSDAQKRASVALVQDYFAALDGDRFVEAHGMFLPAVSARITPEQLGASASDNRARYGAKRTLQIRNVRWAPRGSNVGTGVAAVVEFDGQTETAAIVCGVVTIAETTPGAFKIFGVDETSVTTDVLERANAAERRQFLDRRGCQRFLALSAV